MKDMITIAWEILFPIFAIIIAGYFLQKKFSLDLTGFTKIQLYLFIPALIFVKIATSQLDDGLIGIVLTFTALLFVILMIISYGLAKLLGVDRKKEKAFMNAITLRNQGNFGIPLITLLYAGTVDGNTFPLSVHMIALFGTNLLLNTIGLYNASSGTYTKKEALIKVLKLPMIYVVLFGFIYRSTGFPLEGPIYSTLIIMGNGVVPLALFTLGAQLASTRLTFIDKSLPVVVLTRLVISPLIAYGLTLLFGLSGIVAQVLIIGAAAPTAVNSVLLAMEFNGDAEYASESVFLTTLISLITVTLTIMFVR